MDKFLPLTAQAVFDELYDVLLNNQARNNFKKFLQTNFGDWKEEKPFGMQINDICIPH